MQFLVDRLDARHKFPCNNLPRSALGHTTARREHTSATSRTNLQYRRHIRREPCVPASGRSLAHRLYRLSGAIAILHRVRNNDSRPLRRPPYSGHPHDSHIRHSPRPSGCIRAHLSASLQCNAGFGHIPPSHGLRSLSLQQPYGCCLPVQRTATYLGSNTSFQEYGKASQQLHA